MNVARDISISDATSAFSFNVFDAYTGACIPYVESALTDNMREYLRSFLRVNCRIFPSVR